MIKELNSKCVENKDDMGMRDVSAGIRGASIGNIPMFDVSSKRTPCWFLTIIVEIFALQMTNRKEL